mmetsp:Transcript_18872/g.43997  ORF Transcript_18872/g.43997 Transcript_18872/m.43997 type:complete len:347 (+) Transcript_18872:59-1099(+)
MACARRKLSQAALAARCSLPVLPLLLLLAGLSFSNAQFNINAIESRPSYNYDFLTSEWTASPPVDWKKHELTRDGYVAGVDSSVNISRFTHIGCFEADFAITYDTDDAVSYDPNECMQMCKQKYAGEDVGEIIVAVHQDRCGCVLSDMTTFREVPSTFCTYYCKYYRNPICGGFPDYWGVFREFDFVSLTGQGAYDPWRYIWYSVVAIRESNIRGGVVPDGMMPERYYLHAVDVNSGDALFQFQMPLNGILYGLQYDLDQSRLVALHTEMDTGRITGRLDPPPKWRYKLAVIFIDLFFCRPARTDTVIVTSGHHFQRVGGVPPIFRSLCHPLQSNQPLHHHTVRAS